MTLTRLSRLECGAFSVDLQGHVDIRPSEKGPVRVTVSARQDLAGQNMDLGSLG